MISMLSETNSILMLPISDYAWAEQHYFKDVSAPLESICYLGPHVWYILKKAR